jgi:hypothetical protein
MRNKCFGKNFNLKTKFLNRFNYLPQVSIVINAIAKKITAIITTPCTSGLRKRV